MSRESRLARTFVEIADTLVDDFDVADLLIRLVDRCVEVLEVDAAGLMLLSGGDLRVMATSDDSMRDLQHLELDHQEGPCLDCFRTGAPVVNHFLNRGTGQWPRFTPAAMAMGIQSVHAVPMRLRGVVIGALNVFQRSPGGLRQPDVDAAQALADVATIAILQHQAVTEAQVLSEQLQRALESRVVIEQAKGVISERASVDVDEAFRRLRHHARSNNRRLAEVAVEVVDGRLPAADLRGR